MKPIELFASALVVLGQAFCWSCAVPASLIPESPNAIAYELTNPANPANDTPLRELAVLVSWTELTEETYRGQPAPDKPPNGCIFGTYEMDAVDGGPFHAWNYLTWEAGGASLQIATPGQAAWTIQLVGTRDRFGAEIREVGTDRILYRLEGDESYNADPSSCFSHSLRRSGWRGAWDRLTERMNLGD